MAAIERAGRARRRRRAAGLAIGCGLLLAPLAVVTVRAALPDHTPAQRTEVATSPTPSETPAETTVRVVASGERVKAGAGVEIWLTGEGKHWSTPEMDHQFQSADDPEIEPHRPHVGLHAEELDDRYFLSGVYEGTDDAARVVVDTSDGKVTASLVRLAGAPGWGVWYADLPTHDSLAINDVTLFNTRGKAIAAMTPAQP
ncbi:hypothetical protein ACIP2X_09480 [Streptomyces sp. NPDC089424]|uniref:hypothetical protein n=1 Tax=Streptomyces sp. NPDC089424 TaxID=3365917 RepID=UPI0037F902C4